MVCYTTLIHLSTMLSNQTGITFDWVQEILIHFEDGSVGTHTVKCVTLPAHRDPQQPSKAYVQSWKEINPSIVDVTAAYYRVD